MTAQLFSITNSRRVAEPCYTDDSGFTITSLEIARSRDFDLTAR